MAASGAREAPDWAPNAAFLAACESLGLDEPLEPLEAKKRPPRRPEEASSREDAAAFDDDEFEAMAGGDDWSDEEKQSAPPPRQQSAAEAFGGYEGLLNSSDAAATCTGTATAANTTCDLDGGTDGSADCPAGCSVTAAVSGVRTEPCDAGSWATADVGWAHVACDRAGGRVVLVTRSLRFGGGGKSCAAWPSTDLIEHRNPTCDIRHYQGGQWACNHGWSLLDAEQQIP